MKPILLTDRAEYQYTLLRNAQLLGEWRPQKMRIYPANMRLIELMKKEYQELQIR